MSLFNKHFWKFLLGFLGIVALGLVWLFGAEYFNWAKTSGDATANGEKYFRDLQKKYEQDTYGGKTPEETLALFIAALKAGNTDLAARYFIPDDREKIFKDLQDEKNIDGDFKNLISRLGSLKRTFGKSNPEKEAFFIATNEKNVVQYEIYFGKNTNSIWKILSL